MMSNAVAAALTKKLLLKPNMAATVLNAPKGYLTQLGSLPKGVVVRAQPKGKADFVQGFAQDSAELAKLAPKALAAVKEGGVLWICYPKISGKTPTDLTRDEGWEPLTKKGWESVATIAIDATWSAVRFRPGPGRPAAETASGRVSPRKSR